jgi:methylenetetrahydrofolate dehydrogenase (NADP+)/methenyltetrahydrofolate cyclohydrolase
VVIDVGMNRVTDAAQAAAIVGGDEARMETFRRRGNLLTGDVHPLDMARLSSAFTPVPGGVGPLTIAMLMSNTLQCAEMRLG